MAAFTALFTATAASVMRPAKVVCTGETACRDVVSRMVEANTDCALVTRGNGVLKGMLTEQDVLRRITFRLAPETPVKRAMTAAPQIARANQPLYRLLAVMTAGDLTHLPVVDAHDQVLGVLHRQDLLALDAPVHLRHLGRLATASTTAGLAALKQAQAALAADLLADNVDATAILQLLSGINDDIYRQLVANTVESLAQDGWGRPPLAFAVIVMGSGGRGESFLGPDQDNGLILADYPDHRHKTVDPYFTELATRLTRDLDTVGIPLCPGNVMATNPVWRKSLPQWLEQMRGWIHRPTYQGFLNANILLDFRGICGDLALALTLRARVVEQIRHSRSFLRSLTLNESTKEVGLGWFDRLLTESREGAHEGEFNIKRNGIMPIVEGIRLYALAHGIEHTSTSERMTELAARGQLQPDQLDALRHAHGFMCGLLLRQQLRDLEQGRPAGRHVAPATLTSREHDTLVSSMKASQALLRRLHTDLVGTDAA